MKYGYIKQVNLPFDEAVGRIRAEFAKEGFGVLIEIDVKTTLKQKLNVDYNNYLILGVCNPQLAYQALLAEQEVGLLLPCNVIVYEDAGKMFVATILPTAAMSMIDNPILSNIAVQAEEKLKSVLDSLNP